MNGCRGSLRSCRWPSPFRSRWDDPPRAIPGRGPFTDGSRGRSRRRSAWSTRARLPPALGEFVAALQQIDSADAPEWARVASRGRPLATRDAEARSAIAALGGTFDRGELTAAWEEALRVPAWEGRAVWFHGDLHTTNLLACDGRLSAVIDFGCLGAGDPACDLMPAWIYLSADTRDAFRAALTVDDATWARGRGWALSVGLIALPYYEMTNPVFAGVARHAIDEALADRRG